MSQPECDPGETTQFEAKGPAGTGVKISSKRMSELVAVLALVVLAGNVIITWQVLKTIEAQTAAINARAAESRAIQTDLAIAFRELVCVQLLPEPERRQCKQIARAQ